MGKDNPRRKNKVDGRHYPELDGCYKRCHKGAALARKGLKQGIVRIARHMDKQKIHVEGEIFDAAGKVVKTHPTRRRR